VKQASVEGEQAMMRLRRASVIIAVLASSAMTGSAEAAWVLWKHTYEVWVDKNKDSYRRDVTWKKVALIAAKADCNDRATREARAEYDTLTGKGVRATLSGSEVGFDRKNTRFRKGYQKFECWPDTVDPRGPKAK
jgi:hypothetical protein